MVQTSSGEGEVMMSDKNPTVSEQASVRPGLSCWDVLGLGAQVLLQHLMSYKFIRKRVLEWLEELAKKHKVEVWKGYRAFQERWIYHYHSDSREYTRNPSQFHTVLPDGRIKQTNDLKVGEETLLKTYSHEQGFTGQKARHEIHEYVKKGKDGKPIVVQIWPGRKGNLKDHAHRVVWECLAEKGDLRDEMKRAGEAFQETLKNLFGNCLTHRLFHVSVINSCQTPVIVGKRENLLSFLSEPGVQSILMIRKLVGTRLTSFVFGRYFKGWGVKPCAELNDGDCLYYLHKRVGDSTLMVVKSKGEIEQDGYSPLDFHIDACAPDGEQLGAGSFATVQAYRDQKGEKVAVKRFNPKAAKDHFNAYRERDICCRIRDDQNKRDEQNKGNASPKISPFLVRIREVFYTQGSKRPELCIVMSWYPTDLERKIAGGELVEAKTLQWMAQLFLALEYLHTHMKVVHRDVKPANILLDSKDQVKLTDFGTFWMQDWSYGIMKGDYSANIPGTPGYIAPEVVELYERRLSANAQSVPDKVPFWVDFYSMGAVYWEALGNHIKRHSDEKKDASELEKIKLLAKLEKANASEFKKAVDQVLKEKEKEKAANLATYRFISKLVKERPSHQDIKQLDFFSPVVQEVQEANAEQVNA